jgi:hypothetical protein
MMRKLPIGVQDFEKLRNGGNVYVDKTRFVWDMVQSDIPYVLGRPRRFGKSLLCATLRSYFEGRKDLFEGLAIAELEKEWKAYPVIHLMLNVGFFDSVLVLEQTLGHLLGQYEKKFGLDTSDAPPAARFQSLIQRAYEKTGSPVVVIIDEYDKPLTDSLTEPE